MKLGTVVFESRERVVADLGAGRMLDLHLAAESAGLNAGHFVDMLSVIYGGDVALAEARSLLEDVHDSTVLLEEEVTFCPPILPIQYRDCLVFEEHLKGSFAQAEKMTGRAFDIPKVWYNQPIYYKGNRMSFVGHQAIVEWPSYAQFLDVEQELAIVIGRKGKDISEAEAPGYILAIRCSTMSRRATPRWSKCQASLVRQRARTLTPATFWVPGLSLRTRFHIQRDWTWKSMSTGIAGAAEIPPRCTIPLPGSSSISR